MNYNREELLNNLEQLLETPSVVGYYPQIHATLEEIAGRYGYEVEYDNRHTAYIKVPGKNPHKTVALSAHLDTIGLVVKGIEDDGSLRVKGLGGINCHSLEGENMIIHTRFHGDYTGVLICKSHSVHVYPDARTLEREPDNMRILVDEEVHSRQDVLELGILPGDLVSTDPKLVITPSGFIKSRFIDDKAHVAVLLECLRLLKEYELELPCNTWFIFNMFEEIGLGARYVPEEVEEWVALDIACTGEEQTGSETSVTICAADRIAPYDWELTNRLYLLMQENGIQGQMDVFRQYSSDATAAISAGRNLKPALIGAGVLSSHGYERTHIKSLEETLKLTMAYLLDEK